MIREDFLTTQYIWVLENEHVFLTKARHEVERGQFIRFTGHVQFYLRDLRRELDDVPSAVEWAYLFTEMWTRMGGHAPNYAWHSQDADSYHRQRRVLAEHAATTSTNPCAEILLSKLQPCALAPEPEKEEPMSNTVEIKTITYINNADVTKLSDEQLIDTIKTIENEIVALKAVKTKSTKITAKIAEAQDTLVKVVAVLDAR
jgi:hypothetical protein